eukprot:168621-Prorocentrum_minimum.AAC.1
MDCCPADDCWGSLQAQARENLGQFLAAAKELGVSPRGELPVKPLLRRGELPVKPLIRRGELP